MTVFWRPGFNGGYTKLFKVVILNNQTNQTTSSSFISDQGETEIIKVVFDSLSSKTLYIVSMQAINKLGTVEYDGDVHCTTISGTTRHFVCKKSKILGYQCVSKTGILSKQASSSFSKIP